jgi:hypothetical protein
MLVVSETYQNGALSNQLSVSGMGRGCFFGSGGGGESESVEMRQKL